MYRIKDTFWVGVQNVSTVRFAGRKSRVKGLQIGKQQPKYRLYRWMLIAGTAVHCKILW